MKHSTRQSLNDLPHSLRLASVKFKRRHRRKTGVRPYADVMSAHETFRKGDMKKIIRQKIRRKHNRIDED